MTPVPSPAASLTKKPELPKHSRAQSAIDRTLVQALKAVHDVVPPLWPLADYVAVNPCFGLVDRPLVDAHLTLSDVRDCHLLMPRDYFRRMQVDGRLTMQDLAAALNQCVSDYPQWFGDLDLASLTAFLTGTPTDGAGTRERFHTVAEAVDQWQQSSWTSHIINDITRHCAAHYDQGQAAWTSPWYDETLYTAWRQAAQLSRRMDLLGLKGFRTFVASLPENPQQAVQELLHMLEVPASYARQFLLCEAFSVAGWASYVRYRVREAESAGRQDDDLVGLLAIRLAYDVALSRTPGGIWPLNLWPDSAELEDGVSTTPRPTMDILARYALQVAAEQVYRRELLEKLTTLPAAPRVASRKALQIVFCIDVRSEVMRRNLESIDAAIETFGFAGFFGMPLEYVPMGFSNGTPQCPVLLQPSFQVHESLRGVSESATSAVTQKRIAIRQARKLWKAFQGSATSCFSFVESLGLPYVGKLLTDSFLWTAPAQDADADGLSHDELARLGPDIHAGCNHGLDAGRRTDLAEGMLRNLGLTTGFARTVMLCGHASDVTNNPYRAALDCGACGGHSGEPNARVAAALLNDADVRVGLASRGIQIPDDTVFIAAVHNTTTDAIDLCDAQQVAPSHSEDLAKIEGWLREAGRLSRIERCPRLGSPSADDVIRRSRDWAEVRPEWGLAGNAAFIVAPRSRTAGLNLGGRTFMHSYEHQLDPELKVLELIMTAPMVVTNWINMQYYASTVDPVAFGSGNKVIHNMVGQLGILEGNGGDLMTGLPWQCVHDGKQLQHEPLRLLVVIDAPRSSVQQIVDKHELVRNLVTNGWVCLMSWEEDKFYRWTANGTWELQAVNA